MKNQAPNLLICLLAASWLVSGCATGRSRSATSTPCCATNAPLSATAPVPLPDKSIYLIDSTWTTDTGQSVKLDVLRGRPQVMVLFFTKCENACPITVSDMKRIGDALPGALRGRVGFTLISFDPARDTVEALHAYRLRRALDADRWTLLRGEPADVAQLAARLGLKWRPGARGQFSHSNIITLLNPVGEIVRQQAGLNQDIEEAVALLQQMAAR